jgi:hypothetical protein
VRHLIALALAIFCQAANAECGIAQLDFYEADRLITDIDSSRQNLMVLGGLDKNPVEKMATRIAHDDIELTIAYSGELHLLSALYNQMESKADRAVLAAAFVKMAVFPADSARQSADFLTTMIGESTNDPLVREATVLRDKLRRLEAILKCQS